MQSQKPCTIIIQFHIRCIYLQNCKFTSNNALMPNGLLAGRNNEYIYGKL